MNPCTLLSARIVPVSVCLLCRRALLRRSQLARPQSRRLASSFQSYPLPAHPPTQARNAAVPDSSIATTIELEPPLPRVHETRPPKDAAQNVGVSEGVAQEASRAFAQQRAILQEQKTEQEQDKHAARPQPAPEPESTAPSTTDKPRRSRLRTPRKAAMRLTPAAVSRVRALLDGPAPTLLRVGVRNRGCSGLAYHLEYVDAAGAFDEVVEQEGVRVLVDSKALFSILGSEMDWVEDKLSQRFVFRNPNIKEQCGCGESFMV